MTLVDAVSENISAIAVSLAERGYFSAGMVFGAAQGVAKATKEAAMELPGVLLHDPAVFVNGTKDSKQLANGYPEPKRALENGIKFAHDTAASAAAHAKAAHLPSDSKIAQMSSKPMAHLEAKG